MKGTAEHLIWPTTRPPDTADFQSLYGAHFARNPSKESRGIIVGPKAALEPDRQKLLKWLSDVTACLCFDEGNLPEFARRVREDDWK